MLCAKTPFFFYSCRKQLLNMPENGYLTRAGFYIFPPSKVVLIVGDVLPLGKADIQNPLRK